MTEKTFKERQRENKAPMQFGIYKGATGKWGALRLNLRKAYQDTYKGKDNGCIFLDMAPATGPNIYDWDNNKIVMALNITDISKIILYLRAPQHPIFSKTDGNLQIFHDKDAGTANAGQNMTSIEVTKPADKNNTFINAYQKKDGQVRRANVTISPDEALTIGTLLQASIPLIIAWNW